MANDEYDVHLSREQGRNVNLDELTTCIVPLQGGADR